MKQCRRVDAKLKGNEKLYKMIEFVENFRSFSKKINKFLDINKFGNF